MADQIALLRASGLYKCKIGYVAARFFLPQASDAQAPGIDAGIVNAEHLAVVRADRYEQQLVLGEETLVPFYADS